MNMINPGVSDYVIYILLAHCINLESDGVDSRPEDAASSARAYSCDWLLERFRLRLPIVLYGFEDAVEVDCFGGYYHDGRRQALGTSEQILVVPAVLFNRLVVFRWAHT